MSADPGFAGVVAGRPFTVRDLEAMPDDGHRYELIDGVLIVTPADGRYREVADVSGDEPFTAERPFPVTIVPARLLDGLRAD